MRQDLNYVSREHIVMVIRRSSNYLATLLRGIPFEVFPDETGQCRWYHYPAIVRALTKRGYNRNAVVNLLHEAVADTGQEALAYGRREASFHFGGRQSNAA